MKHNIKVQNEQVMKVRFPFPSDIAGVSDLVLCCGADVGDTLPNKYRVCLVTMHAVLPGF